MTSCRERRPTCRSLATRSRTHSSATGAPAPWARTGTPGRTCFTEDAHYVEHVLGDLQGREAIRAWIKPIMAQYGELYTAYEWHIDRRRTRPRRASTCRTAATTRAARARSTSPASPSSTTRATDTGAARRTSGPCRRRNRATEEYARRRARRTIREHREKRTRLDWGSGPEWTRGGRSWSDRPGAAR